MAGFLPLTSKSTASKTFQKCLEKLYALRRTGTLIYQKCSKFSRSFDFSRCSSSLFPQKSPFCHIHRSVAINKVLFAGSCLDKITFLLPLGIWLLISRRNTQEIQYLIIFLGMQTHFSPKPFSEIIHQGLNRQFQFVKFYSLKTLCTSLLQFQTWHTKNAKMQQKRRSLIFKFSPLQNYSLDVLHESINRLHYSRRKDNKKLGFVQSMGTLIDEKNWSM